MLPETAFTPPSMVRFDISTCFLPQLATLIIGMSVAIEFVRMVRSIPAPWNLSALLLMVTPLVQFAVPAGRETVSPSAAFVIAAWTSADVKETAGIVAPRAVNVAVAQKSRARSVRYMRKLILRM